MDEDRTGSDESFDDALPAGLREDLLRLHAPAAPVPPQIDAAILSRAKAGYAKRVRWRPVARWAALAGSIAAAVAIAFVLRAALFHPTPHQLARFAPGDIDGNGRVDILDAYLLAKRLGAGVKPDRAWDVNGDGVVDQKDVDWIANRAVRIVDESGGGAK
ncbi:MAG TPA: dockerin type I domain-containing protein [Tepidisphaeraceae bacterium]|jgi:hypothetical protein|nr:dockerin type I domain-containing protein [Tepidisphaeraceae bacterium]